ncbi:MAG: AMP-binding protein, partial [Candidatus Zixiibacteriota bacterium]
MNSKQTGIPSAKENIPAWIISAAEDRGNHVALVAAGGLGESISYADLASRIRAAAGGLKSLGLRRLDCVALLSENCPDWAICYLAIQATGATVVPL